MRFATGTTLLLAGTKRGLFLFSSTDRASWTSHGQILTGGQVYNAVLDVRGASGGADGTAGGTGGGASGGADGRAPRMFAADNLDIYGSVVRFSDDFGDTWHEPSVPIKFPEGSGETLKNIWIVQPGRDSEPDTIYAGVDPASLWVSRDRGDTWEADAGLMSHPTRPQWQPGLGGLCLHSIAAHPTDPMRMWVAASAVGVLGATDGGASWRFMNQGVPARHMPDEYPEYGQCVHRMLVDPSNPERLVQQNHWGLFTSDDAGQKWSDMQANVPSFFGFPMAMDPRDPQTLFIVPQTEPDAGRHNLGDQFSVWRTRNGGESWEQMSDGLPGGKHVRLGVLRHGLCTDTRDPCGVYVATNTGQIFASPDCGESWNTVGDFLPAVYSVTTATL